MARVISTMPMANWHIRVIGEWISFMGSARCIMRTSFNSKATTIIVISQTSMISGLHIKENYIQTADMEKAK